ncbi:hypothetical protein FRC03_002423 [Tulasnella sp. 419]|nr:hypothetical protein FRC03_002423 [Tulasnella sp. 419]
MVVPRRIDVRNERHIMNTPGTNTAQRMSDELKRDMNEKQQRYIQLRLKIHTLIQSKQSVPKSLHDESVAANKEAEIAASEYRNYEILVGRKKRT